MCTFIILLYLPYHVTQLLLHLSLFGVRCLHHPVSERNDLRLRGITRVDPVHFAAIHYLHIFAHFVRGYEHGVVCLRLLLHCLIFYHFLSRFLCPKDRLLLIVIFFYLNLTYLILLKQNIKLMYSWQYK